MRIILALACAGLAAFAGFLACVQSSVPTEVTPVVPAPPAVAEPAPVPEVVTPVAAVAAPAVAETPQPEELQYERFSRSGHRLKKPARTKAPGPP